MTYDKINDKWLSIGVVLLVAFILGGFCLPHFVEALTGGYNVRTIGAALGAGELPAPVFEPAFKPQGDELALAKLVEAGYFDRLLD